VTSPTIVELLDVEITETQQRLDALRGARALLVPTNGHAPAPVEAKVAKAKTSTVKKGRTPKIADEMLEVACAKVDLTRGVLPQLAELLGVPKGSIHAYAVKAREHGWLPAAGAPVAVATPAVSEQERDARTLYDRARQKNQSDPVGWVADSLGIPRDKAKRLIGLAA
jgi:hypothetical protein